jgi:hypothetical protein
MSAQASIEMVEGEIHIMGAPNATHPTDIISIKDGTFFGSAAQRLKSAEAESVALDIKMDRLTVAEGNVVLVKMPRVDPDSAQAIAKHIKGKCGDVMIIVQSNDEGFEVLDEAAMRRKGWMRISKAIIT